MSIQKRKYHLRARADLQDQTRQRIIAATAELHQEVGPARTTIAEIARRAGVQRLTVYNHFPDERELFSACQGHFLSRHPRPDFVASLLLRDPVERLQAVLRDLYGGYRRTRAMTEKIQRDRATVAALDDLLADTVDASTADLARHLAVGFPSQGHRATQVRAAIALALDFWSWRRLADEGLDDDAAAALMVGAVRAAASGPVKSVRAAVRRR